jgi:hypothetical protein
MKWQLPFETNPHIFFGDEKQFPRSPGREQGREERKRGRQEGSSPVLLV